MLRVGLEIHVELAVTRKLFCHCSPAFGAAANTHTCAYCARREGLATLNEEAADLTLAAARLLRCGIPPYSRFVRKVNTSPYLPGGFQYTQREMPIAGKGSYGGWDIARIQLEEDAARPTANGIDWNRSGIALMEIVTEPLDATAKQARAFAESLRDALRSLRVTDGRMEQGSLRVDANVSLGDGVHTEIKGIASFRHLERAIDAECARQRVLLEEGDVVTPSILHWRERERALVPSRGDYRYRWEEAPEMPPILASKERVTRAVERYGEMRGACESPSATVGHGETLPKKAAKARNAGEETLSIGNVTMDAETIENAARCAIEAVPEAARSYREGKKRALAALVGYAVQHTHVDAKAVSEVLQSLLR